MIQQLFGALTCRCCCHLVLLGFLHHALKRWQARWRASLVISATLLPFMNYMDSPLWNYSLDNLLRLNCDGHLKEHFENQRMEQLLHEVHLQNMHSWFSLDYPGILEKLCLKVFDMQLRHQSDFYAACPSCQVLPAFMIGFWSKYLVLRCFPSLVLWDQVCLHHPVLLLEEVASQLLLDFLQHGCFCCCLFAMLSASNSWPRVSVEASIEVVLVILRFLVSVTFSSCVGYAW